MANQMKKIKIRCIDASGITDSRCEPLVIGEIYSPDRESDESYIFDQWGEYENYAWRKTRFEIIFDTETVSVKSSECPCGIARSQCEYHS
jgi:hypothetical protein